MHFEVGGIQREYIDLHSVYETAICNFACPVECFFVGNGRNLGLQSALSWNAQYLF